MFSITENKEFRKKGFQITLENGYTVSVQFGPNNYCANMGIDDKSTSWTAETAIMDCNKNFHEYNSGDVQGHMTPGDLVDLLNYAIDLPMKTIDPTWEFDLGICVCGQVDCQNEYEHRKNGV
tara:strand:+ start:1067 stop:1432 length:366 start_codon:yes stop_codon:yes gene_type:complete